MAVPSIFTAPDVAGTWLKLIAITTEIKRQVRRIKIELVNDRLNASHVLDGLRDPFKLGYRGGWRQRLDDIQAVITSTAMTKYAQLMLDDPGYDLAPEVALLLGALTDMVTWIDAEFPRDPDGLELSIELVGGQRQSRSLAGPEWATFRADLTTRLDAIDVLIS